ncbi:MAG TPA: hypothetical protein VGJ75_17550 [Dongiaceae bacterium]|jgi:hypothetical protein
MEIKTYDDVLKLRQQFADRLAQRMRLAKKTRAPTAEQVIAEKRVMLKDSQSAMAAVQQAKDEAIKRLDGQLQRLQAKIAGLEGDIDEIEKAKRPAGETQPDKSTQKPARQRKKPRGKP